MTSLSLEEHRADVLALLSPLQPLDTTLADAVGSVLVADFVAPADVPPLPLAAADGYAVRSADTKGARMRPVRLPVTHDVAPGGSPTRLAPGSAARVARGASLPFGADAVVARKDGLVTEVLLDSEAAPGLGVLGVGGEIAGGAVLVPAGTRITPGHVAALSACGASSVVVRPAPRVVIIATGSELSGHGASTHPSLAPHEPVPDASGPLVSAIVAAAGARVVRVLAVPDDAQALRTAIDDAALQADLVITLGGLSGDWQDVVEPVLAHAYGAEVRAVRLSPGSLHGLGTVGHGDGRPVVLLALPGHPVDAAAACAAYVVDALHELRGYVSPRTPAEAAVAWSSPFGFSHAVPVTSEVTAHGVAARPVGDPGAPTLADLASADGVALVPESTTAVKARDGLDVMWWRA